MSTKKRDQVAMIRWVIIGVALLIVVLVAAYGLLYSSGVTQGQFVAGEHYEVLENVQRRRPGTPIEVQEFFSYGCIHCKNLDPTIEEWLNGLPEGATFSRMPVTFNPQWTLLAQTYFTLEELGILEENHTRLFRRIHDRRTIFRDLDEIAAFIDGNGATAEEFLAAARSQNVRRRMREADTAQRLVGIRSVPTLVVAGKYVITMDVGPRVALEVVEHLIALEQAEPIEG